jgi:hypothetical protein
MRLWKDFRTNMMYWRFRYITRNRLRLRQWWHRRRATPRAVPRYGGYRERGTAYSSYRSTRQRTWIALGAMIVLLTALKVGVDQTTINPGLVYAVGTLIVVGAMYWALRGV